MASEEVVLRVFVASPSDVEPERGFLKQVVDELNLIWSKYLGIRLELVRWETHTVPGVGTDAQDVINDQIADDFDIFVGILWGRFGTPTKRAGSGTVEEFERARQKFDRAPNEMRIMVYFNEAAPESLEQIDTDQLSKVRAFRERLGPEGVYYWKYRGIKDFVDTIRIHLSRQLQSCGDGWGSGIAPSRKSLPQRIEDSELDSLREQAITEFRDAVARGTESYGSLTKSCYRLQASILTVGNDSVAFILEVNQVIAGKQINQDFYTLVFANAVKERQRVVYHNVADVH